MTLYRGKIENLHVCISPSGMHIRWYPAWLDCTRTSVPIATGLDRRLSMYLH